MRTRIVGLNRIVAAVAAAGITALSGWAFVSSTASIERDPFQFASIMNANAKVHGVQVARLQMQTVSVCPNNPEAQDHRDPVCLRG
jgi:hypothetical protein